MLHNVKMNTNMFKMVIVLINVMDNTNIHIQVMNVNNIVHIIKLMIVINNVYLVARNNILFTMMKIINV